MEEFDLVVIGAGTAGMSSAGHAIKSGAKIAMVEEKAFGGECLHTGCVPTKTMIRSAKLLQLMRRAEEFGLCAKDVSADFAKVMERKNKIIAEIAVHDDPKNFERAGVTVYMGHANFVGRNELQVGDETIRGKKFIISIGSLPSIPPIEGVEETGYITNIEAVNLDHLPKSLVVLGAGAVGMEFSQIFARLGSDVTVLEMQDQILPLEDKEVADALYRHLADEGIKMLTGAVVTKVAARDGSKVVTAQVAGEHKEFAAEEIMIATGRKANVEGLNLEAAGIEADRRRIKVDDGLRTTAPHVWATGDVNGAYLFTHVAEYEGGIAANNATADQPKKVDYRVIPRATFTDPELASVGMTEREAREQHDNLAVSQFPFKNLDKALIMGETDGMVKIIAEKDAGQILGAHILGPDAGDVIHELVVAMHERVPVRALARTVHAYPTLPEAIYWDSVSMVGA